jgi:hypothetical protein
VRLCLASVLAFPHPQAVLQQIDEETRRLVELRAHTLDRLERERQDEIAASARQRDAEIASSQAMHRARILAAAHASDASHQGPLAIRPPCPCSPADPRGGRAAICPPSAPRLVDATPAGAKSRHDPP